MLGMLDESFENKDVSADVVYIDNPLIDSDDPEGTRTLIYSEFPDTGHAPLATWAQDTSGVREWLFAQTLEISTCISSGIIP